MARQRKPKVRYSVGGYYGTGLRGQANRGILITSRSHYSKAYQVTGRGRSKTIKDISNTRKGRDIRQATATIYTQNRRYGVYGPMVTRSGRAAYKTLKGHGALQGMGVTYRTQSNVAKIQARQAGRGRQRRVRRNYRGQFAGSY